MTEPEVAVVATDTDRDFERLTGPAVLVGVVALSFRFLLRLALEGAGECVLRLLEGAFGGFMENALRCLMSVASSLDAC